MPCAFAALRKSTEDDAYVVDVETSLHRGDGFEHVHFAGPMPARAVDASKAIKLNLSLIGHRRIAGPASAEKTVNELGFDHGVLTSVQPDVKARGFFRVVIFRKRHAVGKNGAVDFGIVGMNLALALVPLR